MIDLCAAQSLQISIIAILHRETHTRIGNIPYRPSPSSLRCMTWPSRVSRRVEVRRSRAVPFSRTFGLFVPLGEGDT